MKESGNFINQKSCANQKRLYQQVGLTENKSDKQNTVGYSPTYQQAGFIENKSLMNQLKEFGLNPRYWILKKLSQPDVETIKPSATKKKYRWMLIHKWEKDLCLLGATEENTGWIDLEWVI